MGPFSLDLWRLESHSRQDSLIKSSYLYSSELGSLDFRGVEPLRQREPFNSKCPSLSASA